jgi:hypothetical protein
MREFFAWEQEEEEVQGLADEDQLQVSGLDRPPEQARGLRQSSARSSRREQQPPATLAIRAAHGMQIVCV